MLIDPFVVFAQIVNFLILVALLKRFLYQPILQAMAGRSQRIERQLALAAAKEQDAETEKQLYQQKQQKLEAQKRKWLEQAEQEVKQEKARLIKKAQAEVNQARSQWYKSFEQDRAKFTREIRDRLSQQVTITARQALSDLANANLEAQIIEIFINRLYNLQDSQLELIQAASTANPHPAIAVLSSFTVCDRQKELLITAIREQIAHNAEVKFEMVTDFICGIELRCGGYKISWHLEHYLTELELKTTKILAEQ
ncbi:MAG: ATP synthase subunit B [Pleurocapsa sp.]